MLHAELMARESLKNANLAIFDVCNVVFAKCVMSVMPWRKQHMGVQLAVEGNIKVLCK